MRYIIRFEQSEFTPVEMKVVEAGTLPYIKSGRGSKISRDLLKT